MNPTAICVVVKCVAVGVMLVLKSDTLIKGKG